MQYNTISGLRDLTTSGKLYPNVKGCGYPPILDCLEFFHHHGKIGEKFPCYVSSIDSDVVITSLDMEQVRIQYRILTLGIRGLFQASLSVTQKVLLIRVKAEFIPKSIRHQSKDNQPKIIKKTYLHPRSCKRSDTLFQKSLLLFTFDMERVLLQPANSLLQPAKKVRI